MLVKKYKVSVSDGWQFDYAGFANEADDVAEYVVPVKWLHTVPAAKAFSETGLFGNQNTVCKPVATKWRHTVERLRAAWGVGE